MTSWHTFPSPDLDQVCAAILAGGKSTRMGQDKGKLSYQGVPLIEYQQRTLDEAGFTQVLLSGNQVEQGIPDIFLERGPIGAIHGLLAHLQKSENKWLLCCAVDMPLTTADLLLSLVQHCIEQEQSAYFQGQPLPCCIQINQQNLNLVTDMLENNQSVSLRRFYETIGCQPIQYSGDTKMFYNANSPSDWQHLINATKSE